MICSRLFNSDISHETQHDTGEERVRGLTDINKLCWLLRAPNIFKLYTSGAHKDVYKHHRDALHNLQEYFATV